MLSRKETRTLRAADSVQQMAGTSIEDEAIKARRSLKDTLRKAAFVGAALGASLVFSPNSTADAAGHTTHPANSQVCVPDTLNAIFSQAANVTQSSFISDYTRPPYTYRVELYKNFQDDTVTRLSPTQNSINGQFKTLGIGGDISSPASLYRAVIVGNYSNLTNIWNPLGKTLDEHGFVVIDGVKCGFSYENNTYNYFADASATIAAMAALIAAITLLRRTSEQTVKVAKKIPRLANVAYRHAKGIKGNGSDKHPFLVEQGWHGRGEYKYNLTDQEGDSLYSRVTINSNSELSAFSKDKLFAGSFGNPFYYDLGWKGEGYYLVPWMHKPALDALGPHPFKTVRQEMPKTSLLAYGKPRYLSDPSDLEEGSRFVPFNLKEGWKREGYYGWILYDRKKYHEINICRSEDDLKRILGTRSRIVAEDQRALEEIKRKNAEESARLHAQAVEEAQEKELAFQRRLNEAQRQHNMQGWNGP